ncbi:MAG: hypothetical protein Q9159_006258, partial [Coniocarpon cinnabarinum]
MSRPLFVNPIPNFSNHPLTAQSPQPGDFGNHAVAAELTPEFLDYTEAQGNPLRTMGGLQPG